MGFPENDASRAALRDPALRRAFGFDLDADVWIGKLRGFCSDTQFGRIGTYEILKIAGRGGQGLVYQARQPGTGRIVAIKRLSAGAFSTPEMRARFQREIETAATLRHPNIATAYGSEIVDGQPILVMEWVDGVAINRWAQGASGGFDSVAGNDRVTAPAPNVPAQRRGVSEVLRLMLTLCDAIQHAHQRGVIHRDLKPSNLLVDADNSPHVLDFGLAKLRIDDSEAAPITATGAFLGTPAFASPEQARGDQREVDVRSDVYSLGAVLYQMLTGRAPMPENGPVSRLLENIQNLAPVRPSSIDARINGELDAIVLKSLEKEKERRYASIDAFQADIVRYLEGRPVLAHSPGGVYVVRKFFRRHRVAVLIASLVFVLIAATAVTSTILYFRAERQRIRADDEGRKARAALDAANREAGVSRRIREFLQQMFLGAGKSGAVKGTSLSMREVLDRAAEKLDESPDAYGPAEEASLRMIIANSYRELGLDAVSEKHYEAALAARRKEYGEQSIEVAECLDALGRVYRILGKLDKAEQTIEAAWQTYKKVLPENDGYLAVNANSIALVKKQVGKYDESEQWFKEALRRYTVCWGPDNAQMPYLMINLAILYISMERYAEAEVQLREALRRCEIIHGEKPHIDTAVAMSNLADVLARSGDPRGEAEGLFKTSGSKLIELMGPDHPRLGMHKVRYAALLSSAGRHDEAIELLKDAHRIFFAAQKWSDVLDSATAMARSLQSSGRTEEAIESLRVEVNAAAGRVEQGDRNLGLAHLELAVMMADRPEFAEEFASHLQSAESIFRAAENFGVKHLPRVIELKEKSGRSAVQSSP